MAMATSAVASFDLNNMATSKLKTPRTTTTSSQLPNNLFDSHPTQQTHHPQVSNFPVFVPHFGLGPYMVPIKVTWLIGFDINMMCY